MGLKQGGQELVTNPSKKHVKKKKNSIVVGHWPFRQQSITYFLLVYTVVPFSIFINYNT